MRFSEIVRSMTPAEVGCYVDLPELWLQGRTIFGGLQAAVLVRAMRLHARDVPLRSLQISFIAPIPAGRVLVTTQLLRQGKSVTHVEARITIDGQAACVGIGIFGASRESKLSIVPPRPALTAKPESDSKPLPYLPGRSPAFAQHVEMRFGAGRFPFTGGAEPKTQLWCRFKDEPIVDESILIGIADLPPSPGLSVLSSLAIASSMTWTLEILRHDWDPSITSGWLFDLEANAANEGYLQQTGVLWSGDGKAVALSRQSVVVFG